MSTTPNKRPHEDGGNVSGSNRSHSSSPTYYQDDSGRMIKLTSDGKVEFIRSVDVGPDGRMPKIRRFVSRDSDRRSPELPMYRVSSCPNVSHPDHSVALENRLQPKENNKVENCDAKSELRDRDDRFEKRADDGKDIKHERDNLPEYKGDVKVDKDRFSGVSWKDSKEENTGKRYLDVPAGNVDPWNASRTHGAAEVGKEFSDAENRDFAQVREAIGENKVDLIDKDKDRKRKEGKHREGGDRDKERNDRRNNLQLGNSSSDNKELLKEERDSERREKERRDISKDKDRPKDWEKDNVNREVWNGAEREVSQSEKKVVDVPGKTNELGNSTVELKKQKDHDSWKNTDRDGSERRKERDTDFEGEKPEKPGTHHDKESEGEAMDTEGGGEREREREALNCGVQQRKRRPRGSPMANRDPPFRSHTHENEGSQGKHDVSTVNYRVGECMQELIKLWKEYESSQADRASESSPSGPTLEIRIPAEHVSATNRQVRGGQLWGTDIYTNDSDLVAVLMHTGYCRTTASPLLPTIKELHATIRVLPPQDCYISTLRNNVRSRAWGAAVGCSYCIERCSVVKKGGGTIDLEPCLTHSSTLEPTLAPVTAERTMTTRAAASNALRQQRFVREVTIQFNLCNEPWLKYSISVVADKGLKKPLFTSSRMKKGEVLYLETHTQRYELCFNGEKMVKATTSQMHEMDVDKPQTYNIHVANGEKYGADGENMMVDLFRWSRCKKALPQKLMQSVGIPLPLEHVEVLEENVEWEDIQWSQTGVWIAGKEYPLTRAHFLSPN
ncbi:uncharacterized protein [Nicotiana tomentosiformis]|uniref:uncharacterized protein n=1 Tax=Nicotiana tomentosiformis TaxID=4098 RepID=UPI00051BB5F1|nr:uncharacterized protein LOC104090921 [Nicotiana tomentosiformis]XP_009594420.1 uncharacterized protein LOC104090921 [Nicotiana tomentosiformis]